MPTRLILIRHGQTSWNRDKIYCGAKDIGLDRTGRKQAKRLCDRLKSEQVHKVYASDKKRALQTARLVFGSVDIERVCGLGEIHFGVFEGLTHERVMKKYPLVYKKWLKDPFSITIPKGESPARFKARVIRAIKKIVRLNKGKCAAVICHGGAISIFINHIIHLSSPGASVDPPKRKARRRMKPHNFWKHVPSSASITIIEYSKGRPRIKVFNDISHLYEANIVRARPKAESRTSRQARGRQ